MCCGVSSILCFTLFYILFRCIVPECEDGNASIDIPGWWPTDVDPKCYKPVFSRENNASDQICTNTTLVDYVDQCDEWVYEHDNSIVSAVSFTSYFSRYAKANFSSMRLAERGVFPIIERE